MRFGGRRSGNVEDRRGAPGRAIAGGGLGVILIAIVASFFGVNPLRILQMFGNLGGGGGPAPQRGPADPAEEEHADFVTLVLGDTEVVWTELFSQEGETYREPTLVLFTGGVRSGCGFGEAEMGPFYCPADGKVYIDLSFYEEMKERFGAPGDAAQAYVIAHEVGHHVQNLRGRSDWVRRQQESVGEEERNQLSVRLELQADYLAGVWLHHAERARNVLEPGDIEEVITAAQAIGDDRLQKNTRGYAMPETFTHGTSEQRQRWFLRGFEEGTLDGADATFDLPYARL